MQRSPVSVVLLAAALLLGGCATTSSDQPDCGEICGLVVFGVLAIPCGVAAGIGCISGGITRCGEGAPSSQPPPDPAPAETPTAAPAAASMEY